ncbi:MAG TPA: hypothetical protein HA326_04695 [Thermoplasmata archaeon]|nr:hypothetical protein [Thermoplasmata archaeon]
MRTVRLSEELEALLQTDAESKRTSLNALITTILMRYAEWDRYADKFGVVTLSADLFRALLESIGETELEGTANDFGARLPNEAMLFWFKKADLDAFLRYLSLNSQYGNLGEYELEVDGRNHRISIRHDYGENWSKFLRVFLGSVLEKSLGLAPRFRVTRNGVLVTFATP